MITLVWTIIFIVVFVLALVAVATELGLKKRELMKRIELVEVCVVCNLRP